MGFRVKLCSRLITFLLVLYFGSALPDNQRSNDDLTQEVMSSMNRVLNFFKRDYKSINLDGIFGLRVAQGALLSVINDVKNDQLNAGDSVLSQVKGLHNKASLIAQDAMPFLQQSSPEYFQKFKKQVSYPWSNFKPFTNKKLSAEQYRNKPQNRRNLIDFSEETSDRCMTELTGTAKGLAFGQPCHISDECWDLMLPVSEGAQGYALTHQALFFQLGEIQGCTPVFVKRLEQSNIKGGLEEVYNRICSMMYPEMAAIEQKRTLDQSFYQRDLFMEQGMVCGSMGYGDFLSTERLRKILSWQRNDGCFGEKREVVHQDDNDDETEQFLESDADSLGAQQNEFNDKIDTDGTEKRSIDSPFGNIKKNLQFKSSQILRKPLGMRTMRSLLLEKELDDGCMSHVTGVATGLLGVYLRWLLYSHDQLVEGREPKKLIQSKETAMYVNDDLVDALAVRGNQIRQSAHLVPMRRAAMLEKGGVFLEKKVEENVGEGSSAGRVIVVVGIFLVLMVLVVKVFRLNLTNMVKMLTQTKKSSHVI